MQDFIIITWTSGSIDEARRVSRFLVQERLVSNAQITPWIESIYMLDNHLHTEQETKVIFKTHKSNLSEIQKIIIENTSYEIPEILVTSILEANVEYINWMEAAVKQAEIVS